MSHVVARSATTKQSNKSKRLWYSRLLRSARNDSTYATRLMLSLAGDVANDPTLRLPNKLNYHDRDREKDNTTRDKTNAFALEVLLYAKNVLGESNLRVISYFQNVQRLMSFRQRVCISKKWYSSSHIAKKIPT